MRLFARQWTNCLFVALALWISTRGRGWIGLRRSQGLKGKVPHFGHLREKCGGQYVVVIDAIPPRRKDRFFQGGDSFILFRPTYRATKYRRVAVGTGDDIRMALRQMWHHDICRHCGRMP